ncbi:MAG TPA: 3'(2'),5'-bisphosphate nucleotidase CysQ [Xanthobacteraceae bacterium]|nr:3'(2'),5'-bisphosphate nucleotidase CysQ [Xanthobacteraceae bacterium]
MTAAAKDRLASQFAALASKAGAIIMDIYGSDSRATAKADGSPVTAADRAAERLITAGLAQILPDMTIIAEESFKGLPGPAPERFVLVDPLDGTREFISRNGEFTVNIALVEAGKPVVGCVYAPALDDLYLAGDNAYGTRLRPGADPPPLTAMQKLKTKPYPADGLRAMASRSHLDPESESLLARLNVAAWKAAGSSLKFCLIARGDGDVYPRLAPTMEWDTGAGQAVLTAAGGCVIGRDGAPLSYGKPGFRNTGFVAWGGAPLA